MKTYQHFSCGILLLGMFPSASVQAAADLEKAMANPNNWAHARGQYNNQGYSKLNQINTKNVKNLKLAWSFATGVNGGHTGAPLVIDGVMYVLTAFPNNIYALDLNNNQKILWSYYPKQSSQTQSALCCGSINRGLAYGNGKVLLQQNDGTLVALDMKFGQKEWEVIVNNPATGATNTNAPLVIKDKVITGCDGGRYGVRCFIAAYYIKDGSLAWKAYATGADREVLIGQHFNKTNPEYNILESYQYRYRSSSKIISIAPHKKPTLNKANLGIKSWKKRQKENNWQYSGADVNGYVGYDPKTNLLYYGTGSPSLWNPDMRLGDNKWTSSVFARDLDSGNAQWAMQTTPHDEASYGANNEVILFNKGEKRYATQINNNGFIYTWLANNGTLISASKVQRFVNWATNVNINNGVPAKNSTFIKSKKEKVIKGICPSAFGAKALGPAAYSPKTGNLYTPLIHMCGVHSLSHKQLKNYDPYRKKDNQIDSVYEYSGPEGVSGGFGAYNPPSGKKVWYIKEKYPVLSGVLATAGDLVAYGTVDHWFKIRQAKSGKTIWKIKLGSGIVGSPFTYQLKGKQYLGVYTGVGGRWIDSAKQSSPTNSKVTDTRMYGIPRRLMMDTNFISAGAVNVFSL